MTNDRVIASLKRLAELCRAGQQGYQEAAEHIGDSQLRSYFNDESMERARYASDLHRALHQMGAEPESEAAAPELHRGWDVSGTIAGDDGVLAAVEEGEDLARKAYEEALQEPLPETIEGPVRSQAQAVIAAHDHVKLLREKKQAA